MKTVEVIGAFDPAELAGGTTALRLSRCRLDANDLTALARLRNLERIDLSSSTLRGGVHMLAKLPKLRSLDLPIAGGVTDADLQALARAPRLEHLRHGGHDVTDRGVAALATAPKLVHLDLGGAPKVTDAGLGRLVAGAKLQWLGVAAARRVTGAFLSDLRARAPLKHLALMGCRIDRGLEHLARAPGLTWLDLRRTPVGDEALAALAARKLEHLDLSGTKVTEDGLRALPPDLLARVTLLNRIA